MSRFTIHTTESAPAGAREKLAQIEKGRGFVPNLLRVMADSPATLNGYLGLHGAVASTSLSGIEREVIALAISREIQCAYCMAAHTRMALAAGVDEDLVRQLRDGEPPNDLRLRALLEFAVELALRHGHVSPERRAAMEEHGFSHRQFLEILLVATHTLMTNLANHLADVPVDEAFQEHTWSPGVSPA